MMKNKSRSQLKQLNERGIVEIVGVLAMAAVGAVVVLSGVDIGHRMTKNALYERQVTAAKGLQREIETVLALGANCNKNFTGKTPAAGVIHDGSGSSSNDDLVDSAGTTVINVAAAGATYGNGMLRVKSWELAPSGTIIDPGPPYREIVNFNVIFEKTQASSGPVTSMAKMKMIAVSTGAGTPITTCQVLIGSGTDIWVRTGPAQSIATTSTGNVGIGTTAPTKKIDILGDTTVTGNFIVQGLATSLNVDAQQNFTTLGKLGIGLAASPLKLDVNGTMSVAGTATVAGTTSAQRLVTSASMTNQGNLTTVGIGDLQGLQNLGTFNVTGNSLFHTPAQFNVMNTAGNVAIATANIGAPLPIPTNGVSVRGNADVTGTVTAFSVKATSICRGGNCATTFAQQNCPAGMIRQLNADGTVLCSNPNCSIADSYFQGFTAGGAPICTVIPTASCAVGQYMSSVNPYTGVPTCQIVRNNIDTSVCPGNQQMVGVNGGVPTCQSPVIPGGACAPPDVVRGISPSGSAICGPPGVALMCPVGQVAIGINANGSAKCGFQVAGGACAAYQMVTGINSDGSPVCGPMRITGITCPQGSVVTQITAGGVAVCGLPTAGPPPPTPGPVTCVGTTVNWGPNSCTGTLTTANYPATQAASTSRGSANYTCNGAGNWVPTGTPTCPAQQCAPALVRWTASNGNTCSAMTGSAVNVGSNASATDSNTAAGAPDTTGGTGSAQFLCQAANNFAATPIAGSTCNVPAAACGTSAGQTYSSPPSSSLCADGTTPGVTSNASTYDWSCGATACSATRTAAGSCNWVRTASNTSRRTDNIAQNMPGHKVLALLNEMMGRVPQAGACVVNATPCYQYEIFQGGLCFASQFGGTGMPYAPAPLGTTVSAPSCDTLNVGQALPGVDNNSCADNTIPDGSTWTCTCPAGPVNGACGAAQTSGSSYATSAAAQAAGLCVDGSTPAMSGTGPWTWTCAGSNGGSPSPTCTAPKSSSCTANGGSNGGSHMFPDNSYNFSLFTDSADASCCSGTSWARSPSCPTNNCAAIDVALTCGPPPGVNGACGSANNTIVSSAPTANLCNPGTASAVTGTGPWTWTCNGSGGGTNATNCKATQSTGTGCEIQGDYYWAQAISPGATITTAGGFDSEKSVPDCFAYPGFTCKAVINGGYGCLSTDLATCVGGLPQKFGGSSLTVTCGWAPATNCLTQTSGPNPGLWTKRSGATLGLVTLISPIQWQTLATWLEWSGSSGAIAVSGTACGKKGDYCNGMISPPMNPDVDVYLVCE